MEGTTPAYQIAVHTGDDRLYHPESTWRSALAYAMRVGPQADYIAIEQWSDTANDCTGGWHIVEVICDKVGYLASVALAA